MSDTPGTFPLSEWRVLDLSSDIAGPYCSKLMTDLGAHVIKVESPTQPDPLRRWTASDHRLETDEDGALFQFLNTSKRSIALDPFDETDRESILKLAERSDLVIESWGPGGLQARGLDVATLQARAPSLSVLSISNWGLEGREAERAATEFTLQASTGSIDYRGLPGRKPVFAGGRIGEWAAGSFAAPSALSSVLSARKTGRGHHVDLAIFEAMVLCLTVYHDLNSQFVEGPLARSIEIPSIEPGKDGHVGFCAITGQQWTDFCAMIGRQDIAEDERYLDGRRRMEHFEFMREMIQGWTREHTVEEMIELAGLLRIPVAPVGNGKTLPEMEQMKERGVFRTGPGGFLQPRPPFILERAKFRPPEPAPKLDSHRAEILSELETPHTRESGTQTDPLPLKGLKVADLTAFWAGPIATSYLADMGADVIKIESIQRPDGMRFAGAALKESLWEWSPVFHGANSGKRDLTLHLDHAKGREMLLELIRKSDVLIENFSVRVLENFGLRWEELKAANPSLILVRMPAFGLEGPWRDRPGFAMTVEQASGLAWMTGYPDLPLVIRGACDPIGGMHAVFALLAALEHRRVTGEGQLVELPLMEVAVNMAAEQVIEESAYGQSLTRNENRGPVSAPQGVYETAEDEALLAVAVPDDASWRALQSAMGQPDWANNPAWQEAHGRRADHDAIDAHLEAWLRTKTPDEALTTLLEAGVPAARLVNAHDLMPHAQLQDRGFFQEMDHAFTGPTRYPGWPMAFSGFPRALHKRPPPTLGEHNHEVLREVFGLSDEEIEQLEEEQIIGTRPSFM
ncbi:MAG: CoA transferase [Spirochaeta sp.]|nr:CoA transferase [Spirochaeta sp.]RPG09954.1 MAG: CoA transferase [Proteobacteria bacterium TMED72]